MCRQPLAIIFPTLITSFNGTSRGTNSTNQFSYVGTAKNDWVPPRDKSQSIQLSSIKISSTERSSEEMILENPGDRVEGNRHSGIKKITDFTVKYGG